MALDVYFRESIARILTAIDAASGTMAALVYACGKTDGTCSAHARAGQLVTRDPSATLRTGPEPETLSDAAANNEFYAEHVRIYRQGYRDALAAVATALGILPIPFGEPSTDGLSLQVTDSPGVLYGGQANARSRFP